MTGTPASTKVANVPVRSLTSRHSRLFAPYRTIGHVCDSLPLHFKRLGEERFVTVSLGHSWQTLNADRLRIVMQSPQHAVQITAFTSFKDLTFAAHGRALVVYRRGTIIASFTQHESSIVKMLLVAQSHLLTVDENNIMKTWSIEKMDLSKKKEITPWSKMTTVQPNSMIEHSDDDDDEMTDDENVDCVIGSVSLLSFPMADGSTSTHSENSKVVALIHPPTYLNKVLIAFDTGALILFNMHSQRGVHEYRPHDQFIKSKQQAINPSSSNSVKSLTQNTPKSVQASAISCLAIAPVAGVIGIGFESGLILQFDLDRGDVISSFSQSNHGCVTALTFRDDGVSHLVTGSKSGDILTWDLGSKDSLTGDWLKRPVFHHLTRHAHNGPIVSLQFFTQEPLLISSSTDNAMHMFQCDNDDKVPHWLKSRSGHSAAPSKIRFYPRDEEVGGGSSKSSDHLILSAGSDRSLRMFSLRREEDSHELGQNKWQKKIDRKNLNDRDDDSEHQTTLTAINSLSFSAQRQERYYANVVTGHIGDAAAHAWSTNSASISNLTFINPKAPLSVVKSTAVSSCGQWAVIGKASGHIEVYSMESAQFKGSFGNPSQQKIKPQERRKGQIWSLNDLMRPEATDNWKQADAEEEKEETTVVDPRHTAAVSGLAVDAMNRWCLSVGVDGAFKVWDMQRRTIMHTIQHSSPLNQLLYHRENDLCAISSDDGSVRVYDCSSVSESAAPTCIRSFSSHSAPLTDLAFHPRGHMLLTAALDGSMHVHDLRSAQLVDALSFASPVVSCAWSPSGDCIATSHSGNLGIQLWINKEWAGEAAIEAITADQTIDLDIEMDQEEAEEVLKQNTSTSDADRAEEAALNDSKRFGLIRFSSLPRSRWHTLLHIDALRTRNKAQEKDLTKNAEAPFFLPSIELTEKMAKKRKADELAELESKTGDVTAIKEAQRAQRSRVVKSHGMINEPEIIEVLRQCERAAIQQENTVDGDESNVEWQFQPWLPAVDFLHSMSAPEIDATLQSLSLNPETESEHLLLFLHFFIGVLPTYRYFEFLQTIQLRFLRLHALTLRQSRDLYGPSLSELARRQKKGWRKMENKLVSNMALVKHLAHIQ